jgi:hypothetical protein
MGGSGHGTRTLLRKLLDFNHAVKDNFNDLDGTPGIANGLNLRPFSLLPDIHFSYNCQKSYSR